MRMNVVGDLPFGVDLLFGAVGVHVVVARSRVVVVAGAVLHKNKFASLVREVSTLFILLLF